MTSCTTGFLYLGTIMEERSRLLEMLLTPCHHVRCTHAESIADTDTN